MRHKKYVESLSDKERELLDAGYYYYEVTFKNIGGLVMPLILEFEYTDGTKEVQRIPAEIWRMMPHKEVTKVFPVKKEIAQITLDPFIETADTDMSNNYFPPKQQLNRFELFKNSRRGARQNPMQRAQKKMDRKEGSE